LGCADTGCEVKFPNSSAPLVIVPLPAIDRRERQTSRAGRVCYNSAAGVMQFVEKK